MVYYYDDYIHLKYFLTFEYLVPVSNYACVCVQLLSCVQLLATPWTATC